MAHRSIKGPHAGHTSHPDKVIVIRDLAKSYGRTTRLVSALDGVSLTVHRGEVFGLLGRNGAGKTTLMRTLLGFLQPQEARCSLFGRDPAANSRCAPPGLLARGARLSQVPLSPADTAYCGALSGLRGLALAAAVERELTRSELEQAANREARQLSKGMRQRLSLAQAFLHDPELLVLDEPTADLDPIGRRQVRDMIVDFRERGGTVLLNSHLLSEVERVCDRIAVIHGGRLLREGPVDVLLSGDRELEDVFVELVQGAGGGTGYDPQWSGCWAGRPATAPAASAQSGSAPDAPAPAAIAAARCAPPTSLGSRDAGPQPPTTATRARAAEDGMNTFRLTPGPARHRRRVTRCSISPIAATCAGCTASLFLLLVGLAIVGRYVPLEDTTTQDKARLFASARPASTC